jgi:hypothetical protein
MLYSGIMLNRFLAGTALALVVSAVSVADGASRAGGNSARQAVNDVPRLDTVGSHRGRLSLTDSGLVFRPCRLASPYPLEYAAGVRSMIFEQVRWRIQRPRQELYVVFRGKLVRRGGKKAKTAKRRNEAPVDEKGAGNARSRVEFLVNRVDSIRVLRFNECSAPRPGR